MTTRTDYINNKLEAIAVSTALPRLAHLGSWETSPQANSVSWALWKARQHELDADAALVLVALAQHAAAALYSGAGYTATTVDDIADLVPVDRTVIQEVLSPPNPVAELVGERWSNESGIGVGTFDGWRIPDEALNGNWLDLAARRAHYGQAANNRKEEESPTTL